MSANKQEEARRFEEVTRAILHKIRHTLGFEEVLPSKRYPAKGFKGNRQIDVTVYTQQKQHLLVECKLRSKRKIGIEVVDAFHTVIHTDVGADGGLIVSSVSFTEPCTLSAEAKHIGLATLNADATEDEFTFRLGNLLAVGLCEPPLSLTDSVQMHGTMTFTDQLFPEDELTINKE